MSGIGTNPLYCELYSARYFHSKAWLAHVSVGVGVQDIGNPVVRVIGNYWLCRKGVRSSKQ